MNGYIKHLEAIGLSEKEGAVYVALLELGTATVSEIAEHANIKRPTTYFVVDDLLQKGLLTQIGGKIKRYSAEKPQRILTREKEKVALFEQMMPGLMGLMSTSKQKPAVRFFTGKEGVRSVYEESLLLPRGTEILCLGNAKAVENSLPGFGSWYIDKRVKGKIPMRALVTDTPYHRKIVERDKKELRKTHLLKDELFTQDIEMNIYRDTVTMVSFVENELVGIIIHSPVFAQAHKQMFELLWKM